MPIKEVNVKHKYMKTLKYQFDRWFIIDEF